MPAGPPSTPCSTPWSVRTPSTAPSSMRSGSTAGISTWRSISSASAGRAASSRGAPSFSPPSRRSPPPCCGAGRRSWRGSSARVPPRCACVLLRDLPVELPPVRIEGGTGPAPEAADSAPVARTPDAQTPDAPISDTPTPDPVPSGGGLLVRIKRLLGGRRADDARPRSALARAGTPGVAPVR